MIHGSYVCVLAIKWTQTQFSTNCTADLWTAVCNLRNFCWYWDTHTQTCRLTARSDLCMFTDVCMIFIHNYSVHLHLDKWRRQEALWHVRTTGCCMNDTKVLWKPCWCFDQEDALVFFRTKIAYTWTAVYLLKKVAKQYYSALAVRCLQLPTIRVKSHNQPKWQDN